MDIQKKAVEYYKALRDQGILQGLNGIIVCVRYGIAFMVAPSEIDQDGEYFKMVEKSSGVKAINLFE